MSANASTSAIPSNPAAPMQTTRGDGPGVWLEIPLLSARLLWRHWPALAFWFFAQRVCYDLLMDLAVKLGERSVLMRMDQHAQASNRMTRAHSFLNRDA